MNISEIIGKQLHIARESKGLRLQDIADMINVSVSLISHIEKGKKDLRLEYLPILSKELNRPIQWFFGDEGSFENQEYDRKLQQQILTSLNPPTSELAAKLEKIDKKITVNEVASSFNRRNNIIQFPRQPARVAFVEQAVGAGTVLCENLDNPLGHLEIPSKGKPDVAIRVQGLSMEPDILDGSLILVRRTKVYGAWGWNNGDYCVVWLKNNNEWTVKKTELSKDKQRIRLTGLNGVYTIYDIKEVEVQGIVEDIIKDPVEVNEMLKSILNENQLEVQTPKINNKEKAADILPVAENIDKGDLPLKNEVEIKETIHKLNNICEKMMMLLQSFNLRLESVEKKIDETIIDKEIEKS